MLLLLKHHIVTHTHTECGQRWWVYLQYLQYLHWSVQCGAVHRPAVAVVSVSSKHCPWQHQHQHQPPHETLGNGHCTVHVSVVHVLLSRYVDIPLFTICALQYSDYVCNKTFNISCCWDDHSLPAVRQCFTPLINSMVRSGHTSVRSCYILCLAVAIIESVIRSRSPYVYNWWGRVVLHQPSTECKKCNNHYSQSQCKYSPPAISSNVFLVFRIQCNGIMGGGIFTFLIFFTCRLSRS